MVCHNSFQTLPFLHCGTSYLKWFCSQEEQLSLFAEIKKMIAAHIPVLPPPTRTPAKETPDSTPKGSPKKSRSSRGTTPSSSPAHSPPISHQSPQPPTSLNINKPNYSSGSPRISPRGSPSSPRPDLVPGKRFKAPATGTTTKSPVKKAANGPQSTAMW